MIGSPIIHSLSPIVHNYWFQRYRIDGVYVAFTAERERFIETVKGLFDSGVRGMNVTAPFKEQAYAFAEIKTDEARQACAVNTLYYDQASGKIIGTNTDGIGFFHSVQKEFSPNLKSQPILLIGAGGAARGLIAAYLARFPGKIYLINRTYENAVVLRNSFPPDQAVRIKIIRNVQEAPLSEIFLVINSVKKLEASEPLSFIDLFFSLPPKAVIYDINYGEKNTFLEDAEKNGFNIFNGLPMLVFQAAYAFEKFTGMFPELDENFFSFIRTEADSAKL